MERRAKMIDPGTLLWATDYNGCWKLIQVESIFWDEEPELQGWNIICQGEEYYLECCYELLAPMVEGEKFNRVIK